MAFLLGLCQISWGLKDSWRGEGGLGESREPALSSVEGKGGSSGGEDQAATQREESPGRDRWTQLHHLAWEASVFPALYRGPPAEASPQTLQRSRKDEEDIGFKRQLRGREMGVGWGRKPWRCEAGWGDVPKKGYVRKVQDAPPTARTCRENVLHTRGAEGFPGAGNPHPKHPLWLRSYPGLVTVSTTPAGRAQPAVPAPLSPKSPPFPQQSPPQEPTAFI